MRCRQMKAAIVELEVALKTAEINEPILRLNGEVEQADLQITNAADFRQALFVLNSKVGLANEICPPA